MISNYISIVKPGIVSGNLISTAGGFLLASRGRVDCAHLLATLSGVSLVVASGCVCNNCIDRNLDQIMKRTSKRVLARGALPVRAAWFYGAFLGIAGMALLETATNLLCLAIVLTGFFIYGVYGLHFKRTTVHATLIGSLAGAAPPLAGYCAVTNRLDAGALILFFIFILWQIPHYYAIAIFRLDDYAAAAIPILPVKRGTATAQKHIVCYILLFLAADLTLSFRGYTGYSYLAVTAVSGLAWLLIALAGFRSWDERLWARMLYIFSIVAMLLLSVMMSIDFTVPG